MWRNLAITSPHTHGEDVKKLQHAYNLRCERYGLPKLREDGDLGLSTLHAVRGSHEAKGIGYYLGAPDLQLTGPVRPHLQIIVRAPWRRTPAELVRGKRRYIARRRYLAQHRGADAALAWARSQVGTVESPYGSNRGPRVSAYQRNFGIDGAPWCGAFVGTAMIHGGLHPSVRIVYVPYIAQDYRRVSWDERRGGDLVCFNFGSGFQHVGMLDSDRIHTLEGNTSSGSGGSQDNGGGVFRRERPRSTMAAIVRPSWQ